MPESAVAVQDQPPRTTALAVPEDVADAGQVTPVIDVDADALRDALDTQPTGEDNQWSPDLRRRLARLTEPLIAVAIDQTRDYEDKVREQVNTRYTENVNENLPKSRIGRMLRRMKETYKKNNDRQAIRDMARADILDSQNVHYYNGTEEEGEAANRVTHARFMELKTDDVISAEAGETRKDFTEEDDPYAVGVRALVEKYVTGGFDKPDGTIDRDAFDTEKDAFFAEYRKEHGTDDVGEGKVQTDNLWSVAEKARERVEALVEATVEHTESVRHVIDNMRVVAGQAHTSVYRGPEYSKIENWIDKASEHPLGRWVSPAVVAGAATAATLIVRAAASKGASIATGGFGGVAAGAFAYFNERKNLKDERAQHESEVAVGAEFADDAVRRNEMNQFAYDTVKASELIEQLGQFTIKKDELPDDSEETLNRVIAEKFKTKEDIEAALNLLGDVEARVKISNRSRGEKGKTLIAYSDQLAVGTERWQLGLARASVKVALERRLANGGNELFDWAPETTLATVLAGYEEGHERSLIEEVEKQDKAFNSYSRKRALKAAALTAVVGAAAAGLIHGGIVYATGGGAETVTNSLPNSTSTVSYANGASIELNGNSGYTISPHDSILSVKDSAGNPVAGLDIPVDAQGHIAPETLAAINKQPNIHIDYQPTTIPAGPPQTIDQYAAQHQAEFKHLNVTYKDSGSAVDNFNQQGGRLSYNADGSVNISQVMAGDAASNNLLDMSFKQPDGTMIHKTFAYGQAIPKPWADMLYQKPDHTWGFKGNGEIHWGKEYNGTFESYASLGGDGHPVTVPGTPTEQVHYKVMVNIPQTTSTEGYRPFVAPVPVPWARKPLEAPIKKEPSAAVQTEPGASLVVELPPVKKQPELEVAPERLAIEAAPKEAKALEGKPRELEKVQRELEGKRTLGRDEERRALKAAPLALERGRNEARRTLLEGALPELLDNPEAHISLGVALDHHRAVMEAKDPEFMRGIDEELQHGYVKEWLAAKDEAIVPWTIKLTDDLDTIRAGLDYYGKRVSNGHDSFHLLLNVVSTDDGQDDERWGDLLEVLNNVQTEYPEFSSHFSRLNTVIERAKLEGDAYSGRSLEELGDERSYEVIMEAARRAVQANKRAADSDILILRRPPNVSLDTTYENQMIDTMKQNPEKDMFSGGVRWSLHDMYERLPSTSFLTNAMETMRIVGRHTAMPEFQPLDVVNMGCRLSTIAAVGGGGHYTDPRQAGTYDLALVARLAAARQSASTKGHTMYVTGAQVNVTDASLFEATHIFGGSITDAVDKLGSGELTHDLSSVDAEGRTESYPMNEHVVRKQIEVGMTDILNNLKPSDTTSRTALAFLLPMDIEKNDEGKVTKVTPRYRIDEKDGKRVFTLTDAGAKWLLDKFSSSLRYRG